MIVFDASTIVSAALKAASLPERALLLAEATDLIALYAPVEAEIVEVLHRPRFAAALSPARRGRILSALRDGAIWFAPAVRVTDCRDFKDNRYLELALAASAATIVTGDRDLLVLDPWRGVRILNPADYLAAAAPRYSSTIGARRTRNACGRASPMRRGGVQHVHPLRNRRRHRDHHHRSP